MVAQDKGSWGESGRAITQRKKEEGSFRGLGKCSKTECADSVNLLKSTELRTHRIVCELCLHKAVPRSRTTPQTGKESGACFSDVGTPHLLSQLNYD